jgi:cyclopropane-fatty-acyl-phospholipid synthase
LYFSRYGLTYTLIRFFMEAQMPLDAPFVWKFFTRKQPVLIQAILDGYPLLFQRRRIMKQVFSESHASGIEYHYDVSNDFFKLFLDRDFMFYSCADFEHPDDTIEIAQRRKADYLLDLIAPTPGERILDLGCGWGSMLSYIHAATGDRHSLCGYTLSREQARFITDRFGYDVLLQDFVTAEFAESSFDKIYSIGAMEHVRPDEISPLLRKLHRALTPNGRSIHQFFSLNDVSLPTSTVAGQLFFPGSVLTTHAHHLLAAQEAGFRIVHDSTHDYRPTLRAWFDRLVENSNRALQLVGVELYNRFLVLFASSCAFFDQKKAIVHRIVLEKS